MAEPSAHTGERPLAPLSVQPTGDPTWVLVEEGFNLAREHEVESLFAVSNGYVGTRGSLAEGSPLSAPATLVAGVFDVDRPGAVPELTVAPDWMSVRAVVDGVPLRIDVGTILYHRRTLDMKQGILWRHWRHRDPRGRTFRIDGARVASLADRHLLLQSIELTIEDWQGGVRVEAMLRAPRDLPDRAELVARRTPEDTSRTLVLQTRGTGIEVAFAAASRIRYGDGRYLLARRRGGAGLDDQWELPVEAGRRYRLERLVVVYTSREQRDPRAAAERHLDALLGYDFETLLQAHVRASEARWRAADVRLEGDDDAQRAVRFAVYHLTNAANPEDARVSIGARALTGPAYKGHVFWDTEIYMLPLFNFTAPAASRALLGYRYATLEAARRKAARLGYAGALFAWESAGDGEEVTPELMIAPTGEILPVYTGEQEHHISAAVAYAVWQYWRVSGDDDYFLAEGAELLFETARFWASRGRVEDDGRFHIRRVMGPDEYHECVDDNAYTNGLAGWTLARAVEAAGRLAARWPWRWAALAARLALKPAEIARWSGLARRTHLVVDPTSGVIEQFAGYHALETVPDAELGDRQVPLAVVLGQARIGRTQVLKQADVLMLLYLLWDHFPLEMQRANFAFYEPRTDHGSSLSPGVHALLAARLGEDETAQRYFRRTAQIDLANNMGNAAGGVHAAALGGLWQAVVCGAAGLRLVGDGELALEPHLLPGWRALGLPLRFRGARLAVELDERRLTVACEAGPAPTIRVGRAAPVRVGSGRLVRFRRGAGGWEAER